jgi:hypothetical protein
MPGILPMKVIKVGSSSQSRIAQACDRCRSKKIRCDGIRPCCTQCSNVGFECKTSDKLSRRAFPRGYTESLEERVRSLEAEVRELKDLLDEKDEKIDVLARIHSNPSFSSQQSTPPRQPSVSMSPMATTTSDVPKEDVFSVQASPLLVESQNSDAYFMGASSGRAFLGMVNTSDKTFCHLTFTPKKKNVILTILIDAFKRKIQESGKSCPDFNTSAFLCTRIQSAPFPQQQSFILNAPSRLASDQMVNIFFQEWAPLFPVLHRPTFLTAYEEFVAGPEELDDNQKLAQLYLVFSIAALSNEVRKTPS